MVLDETFPAVFHLYGFIEELCLRYALNTAQAMIQQYVVARFVVGMIPQRDDTRRLDVLLAFERSLATGKFEIATLDPSIPPPLDRWNRNKTGLDSTVLQHCDFDSLGP